MRCFGREGWTSTSTCRSAHFPPSRFLSEITYFYMSMSFSLRSRVWSKAVPGQLPHKSARFWCKIKQITVTPWRRWCHSWRMQNTTIIIMAMDLRKFTLITFPRNHHSLDSASTNQESESNLKGCPFLINYLARIRHTTSSQFQISATRLE